MIVQRFMHAGPVHEPDPACEDIHCARCDKDGPRRYARSCSECWHAWRWGWLLSLHDAQGYWLMCSSAGPWDVEPPWYRKIRIRRPSKIWVCPCCSHDL